QVITAPTNCYRRPRPPRTGSMHAITHEPTGPGLCGPHLTGPAENLAHIGARAVARKHLELLRGGVEADHGVGAPVAQPHHVALVDIDGIGPRLVAGKLPGLPAVRSGIEGADVAAVPLAHPDPALRVRPHPPRALPLG